MAIKLYITEEEITSTTNDDELGRLIRRRFWNLKEENEYLEDVEYEHCMICGKLSPYTRNTHITDRVGYVEGQGQGCYKPNKCDKI